VLDVASGSVHSVDDVAYDVIRLYEAANDSDNHSELISHVLSNHEDVTESDILEIIDDVEMLKSQGKLFLKDTFAFVTENKHDAPLKALCLNVSHMCNMSCSYCFAGHGGYGGSGDMMSLETGTQAIDFLIRNSTGRKNLDVDFFGGEPLLNWETVKEIVAYARISERTSGKNFRFTLTTNGLLINDDVIEFTNKEIHNVVLSLDGRPEINDAKRKLPNGDGSYAAVIGNIHKLVNARQGKGYYIRGTFTRHNMDFVNDILHMTDLGFTELSMEPVVVKQNDPHGFTRSDLPVLYEQYERLAAEMLKRKKSGNCFTFYHYILDLTKGPCVHKRIAGCGVATEYLAVTPSGELYPCHQFIGDTSFLMGDIWRGIVNRELKNAFSNTSIYTRNECKDCWAKFYCSGGCAANAFHAAGSIESVYEVGCELFKKRTECAIMIKVSCLS
jgi:uncharacterized protein